MCVRDNMILSIIICLRLFRTSVRGTARERDIVYHASSFLDRKHQVYYCLTAICSKLRQMDSLMA